MSDEDVELALSRTQNRARVAVDVIRYVDPTGGKVEHDLYKAACRELLDFLGGPPEPSGDEPDLSPNEDEKRGYG